MRRYGTPGRPSYGSPSGRPPVEGRTTRPEGHEGLYHQYLCDILMSLPLSSFPGSLYLS